MHLGHREVIRGADTVLTFEPHPRTVVAPDSAPKLLTSLETKADLIAGLGVQELVVIPFDGRSDGPDRAGVHRPRARRAGSARERVSVGENFRFGNRARGDAALLAAAGRVRDARGPAGRARRRDHLLDAHPRADRGGRRGGRGALPRRALPHARHDRPRRQARPHARLPDRQPGARRAAGGARPRHLRLPRRGRRRDPRGGGQRRRPPDLQDRPRPAGGGLPARLRRRHLRPRAAARLPRATARREALRQRRGARRADGRRRRATRARSSA